MPRFFLSGNHISPPDSNGVRFARITGADAHHIVCSLRMKPGDSLTLCDMQSNEYSCLLDSIQNDPHASPAEYTVCARIVSCHPGSNEPPFDAVLYQALPKGDKMEIIVQKAVEAGVSSIVPFLSERCISRPDAETLTRKIERWQRIALEAAKQCGRSIIPQILPCLPFRSAVDEAAASASHAFLCYEGDDTVPLGHVLEEPGITASYRFFIGPEGGFSLAEVAYAQSRGLTLAGLGKRILRCETASGFVLSCLVFRHELS